SSAAVVVGSAGQSDYCAANGFLDAFATWRREQVAQGRRCGASLAIDWPFWRDGGIRLDPASQRAMQETTGLQAMPNTAGINAFYRCLASGQSRLLVLHGDTATMRMWLDNAVTA